MSRKSSNLKKSNLVCLVLVAVFVLCTIGRNAEAGSVVGMAEFEDCVQTDQAITCEPKMSVTVPISYGMWKVMEAVNPLDEATRIEVTKSPPMFNYPLTYFHTVSYYPHEQVLKEPNTTGPCFICIDSPDSNCPTCGLTYIDGNSIDHPQGFCVHDIIDSACSWWRGKELYGEHPNEAPFSTAHCLKMGAVYFDGFEIGEYIKSYEVSVKLMQGGEEHTIQLSPDNPFYNTVHDEAYSMTFPLKAELVGDVDPTEGPLELDNYILYIPSKPEDHPMVMDYQNNMLLVPREEVSKDGGELDKVGISFYKFRTQAGNWRVSQAGDGLHNQLFHKHNSDLMKLVMNPNAETTYLVHGMKDFKDSMDFRQGMPRTLKHNITYINNSLVTLTMDKAYIKTIETESEGEIVNATLEKYTCFSEDGLLKVKIKNIGYLQADYIVTVTNGTMNVLNEIPAQARILDPLDEAELKFNIWTYRGNLETSDEYLITLKSPTGKVYDQVWVRFDTDKYTTKYSWDLQDKNTASEAEAGVSVLGDSTCDKMVDFRDFADFARCWLVGVE
ncbi:MAG: HAP2/GCS1 family protein [Phycisphaerae bacterium]|nr:HAP2/GCS1 family protein [Phycisphaerae bacterium]